MRLFLLVLVATLVRRASQTPNSYGLCNQRPSNDCRQGFRPVCGFRVVGLPLTYSTVCQACSNSKLVAYLEGSCQLHLRNCASTDPHRKDCFEGRFKLRSLCGFFSNGTFENVTNFKTPYSHVVDRPCPIEQPQTPLIIAPEEPSYSYCSKSLRQIQCNSRYEPTCGISLIGLPKQYRSPCAACASQAVFAYLPGTCEEVVKVCNPNRIDCDRLKAPSVKACGFQIGKRPANLNNSMCCRGTTYQHSLPMECPTYPEQFCPQLKEWSCPKDIDWVCGTSKSGHRWTYLNGCSACSLPELTRFTYGKCK